MSGNGIPARNAVNTYLREVRSQIFGIEEPQSPLFMAINSRQPARTYAARCREMDKSIIRTEERLVRKFNQATEFVSLTLVPERFIASSDKGATWRPDQDAIVLRRSYATVRPKKIDVFSVPAGLMVTRHALERMYQRNHIRHDEIAEAINRMVLDIEGKLSFAIASSLFTRGNADTPGAITCIPTSGGLLIVNNVHVLVDGGKSSCFGFRMTPSAAIGKHIHSDSQFHGSALIQDVFLSSYVMGYGSTFLDDSLLMYEQQAYAAMFEEEYGKADIQSVRDIVGHARSPHEKSVKLPPIDLNHRLPMLLAAIARPQDSATRVAIGWCHDPVEFARIFTEGNPIKRLSE